MSEAKYHELKYAIYVRTHDPDENMEIEEDEAVEIVNKLLRKALTSEADIVDWDGPLLGYLLAKRVVVR